MTVDIKYLKPADIDIPSSIKTLAILSSGDAKYRDIAYKVFMKIFSEESVKTRFKILDRENLDSIIKEQKLNESDEFDDSTAAKLGMLSGAQGIILTGFNNVKESVKDSKISITRRFLAADGKYVYKKAIVPSIIKTLSYSIDTHFLDVSTDTVLYSDSKSFQTVMERFDDSYPDNFISVDKWNADSYSHVFRNIDFTSTEMLLEDASKHYGPLFAHMIAPYMVEESITFESIPGDNINSMFYKYLKSDLFEKAKELMISSIDEIKSITKIQNRAKHYFNLGSIYEVSGDFATAKEYYDLAVKDDPTANHLDALKYIEDKIKEKEKLNSQIGDKKK